MAVNVYQDGREELFNDNLIKQIKEF